MLEDARHDPAALDFARACATLVGLGMPNETPGAANALVAAAESSSGVKPAPDERGLDPALRLDTAIASSGPRAMVLVLNLPAATAPEAQNIAAAAQRIAAQHSIPYVKMLGTRLVAAAGYADDSISELAEAAPRLADAAIALRERCAAVLDTDDGPCAFGLGLDVGAVCSATLGEAPGLFNLWGEAVQGADALATSAPAEAIQASQQAYLLLNREFLFRPRGLFYRPNVGEARSYVLAGRA
jgi:adenylate cyclase